MGGRAGRSSAQEEPGRPSCVPGAAVKISDMFAWGPSLLAVQHVAAMASEPWPSLPGPRDQVQILRSLSKRPSQDSVGRYPWLPKTVGGRVHQRVCFECDVSRDASSPVREQPTSSITSSTETVSSPFVAS